MLEPVGGGREPLDPNVGGYTVGGGAGPVRVQVLVHLVDDLVIAGRVLEVEEGGAVAGGDLYSGFITPQRVSGNSFQVEDRGLAKLISRI